MCATATQYVVGTVSQRGGGFCPYWAEARALDARHEKNLLLAEKKVSNDVVVGIIGIHVTRTDAASVGRLQACGGRRN